MDVKELATEYCSLTGRPLFTITVEEYLQLHHAATGQNRIVVTTDAPKTQPVTVPEIPENPVVKQPVQTKAQVVTSTKTDALSLLKSIKG